MEIWPPDLIEDALGPDAAAVLPDAIRLTDLRVRLPRYHVDMLEHFAERDRTTVSGTLARELDAVASAHAEELSSSIAGFAAALAWPDGAPVRFPAELQHPRNRTQPARAAGPEGGSFPSAPPLQTWRAGHRLTARYSARSSAATSARSCGRPDARLFAIKSDRERMNAGSPP
jgi:hypothetical protein